MKIQLKMCHHLPFSILIFDVTRRRLETSVTSFWDEFLLNSHLKCGRSC